MEVFWFLPTHGDSRCLGTSIGARAVDLAYIGQIARPADDLGYGGVLLPTGGSCEDAWAMASAMHDGVPRDPAPLALTRPGAAATELLPRGSRAG